MSLRAGVRVAAALAVAAAVLAACGRDAEEPNGIFIRDAPDGPAPIDPAPDISEIRPVPDLHADEKALALLCAVRANTTDAVCACVAKQGAAAFKGRDLAYFAALVIGDDAEAARLQSGLLDVERAEMTAGAEGVLRQCRLR